MKYRTLMALAVTLTIYGISPNGASSVYATE